MTPMYLLVLATHLVSSTLVTLVEMTATPDWPREVINKNIPGYVIYLLVGMSQDEAMGTMIMETDLI